MDGGCEESLPLLPRRPMIPTFWCQAALKIPWGRLGIPMNSLGKPMIPRQLDAKMNSKEVNNPLKPLAVSLNKPMIPRKLDAKLA